MCLFKTPEIKVPDVETPAPPPPAIESAPTVNSIDFGGGAETETETASGVKGEKSTGKSSLKVKLTGEKGKSTTSKTGANLRL